MKGARGSQVAPRRFAGAQGLPGVVLRGPWVARWLAGAAKVARWHRSRMKEAWGGQVAPRRFPGGKGSPGVG